MMQRLCLSPRIAPAQPEASPHPKVVLPRLRGTALLVGLLLAVAATALGLVYTKHQSRRLFIELQSLQQQRDELEIEWAQLTLEQSTLAAEAVVDYEARTQLGMTVPDPQAVVYLVR